MSAGMKAPSWEKLHDWFVEKLTVREQSENARDQGQVQEGVQFAVERPAPKADYQVFLENASRTMIIFKKPEHLIKMIVKTIDEQLKVTHTAVLL